MVKNYRCEALIENKIEGKEGTIITKQWIEVPTLNFGSINNPTNIIQFALIPIREG